MLRDLEFHPFTNIICKDNLWRISHNCLLRTFSNGYQSRTKFFRVSLEVQSFPSNLSVSGPQIYFMLYCFLPSIPLKKWPHLSRPLESQPEQKKTCVAEQKVIKLEERRIFDASLTSKFKSNCNLEALRICSISSQTYIVFTLTHVDDQRLSGMSFPPSPSIFASFVYVCSLLLEATRVVWALRRTGWIFGLNKCLHERGGRWDMNIKLRE